jgi:hypothetical protein
MKSKPFRKYCFAAAVVLLAISFTRPARALFGIPDIVIDPTAIAKLTEQITQYEQMIQTYTSTFELWKLNFAALTSKQVWKTFGMTLLNNATPNLYGETAAWSNAVNTGTAIPQAWSNATLPLQHPGDFLATETLGTSAHLPALASVELTDGASQNSMSTLANFRQLQTENAAALDQLEQTALSDDPEANTLVGQQNLTNAALMQQMRVLQANGTVNAALLEQQLVANTYRRNLTAATLNTYAVLAQRQATAEAYPQGWADTLANYQPR